MPRKTADLAAARERRMKVIALVGALLLAVLLAIQAPRLMDAFGGGGEAAQPAASATEPVAATASSPPSASSPTSAAAPAKLDDSDLPPEPAEGDLESFERFTSKDPFVQQIRADAAPSGAASAPPSTTPSAGPTAPAPTTAPPATAPAASTPGAYVTPSTDSSGSTSVARSAVISVNGSPATVSVSQAFPASDPVFRLVSLTANAAEIGIVGGSFSSGAKTVTLVKGKVLTLMNTADGKRYRLRLVSVG